MRLLIDAALSDMQELTAPTTLHNTPSITICSSIMKNELCRHMGLEFENFMASYPKYEEI
jgi:hypothetical protein